MCETDINETCVSHETCVTHMWYTLWASGAFIRVLSLIHSKECIIKAYHADEPFTKHVCIRHVTPMNVAYDAYESVSAFVWMSHVTRVSASTCHTYGRVVWHVRMSDTTHMIESCHTYEWDRVMWDIWMRYSTPMKVPDEWLYVAESHLLHKVICCIKSCHA